MSAIKRLANALTSSSEDSSEKRRKKTTLLKTILSQIWSMASINENSSPNELQEFINLVYFLPNDKNFELVEMLFNVQRAVNHGLKAIRQGNLEKTKTNIALSLSWFTSMMIRLHIDVEDAIWQRYPYLCCFCGNLPCTCAPNAVDAKKKIPVDNSKRPRAIKEFQEMFRRIYPPSVRNTEIAGVHLAEELGELTEALGKFRAEKNESDFENVKKEAGDYWANVFGVFNSLDAELAKELSKHFYENCHTCHKAPCECTYQFVRRYK